MKNLHANAGDTGDVGSILGSGRSPRGGNGNLLQYSCLENPMDRGAWWAPVHGFAKSWTRLSTHSCKGRLYSSMTWCLYKKGEIWTQTCRGKLMWRYTGSRPREDRCIGVMPLWAGGCRGLPEARREAWNRCSLKDLEGPSPADTLISDFWPPELGGSAFLLSRPFAVLYDGSPRKQSRGKAGNVDFVFGREDGPRET